MPGRSRSARAFFITVILITIAGSTSPSAQITNILARRWADARVETEEVRFLLGT